MRRGASGWVCALVLLAFGVRGGDPARAEEPAKADPAASQTLEAAADAVLAAVAAKDDAALKALAEKDDPDPWLVADELVARGKHDEAMAFAKAAPRVDVEALPGYLEASRDRALDRAGRELYAAMTEALSAGTPQKVLEGTASLEPKADTVLRLRLRQVRGQALEKLGRRPESTVLLRSGAEAALALGWLPGASTLYREAAGSAYEGNDAKQAVALTETDLALRKRRGDRIGEAWSLNILGSTYHRFGAYPKALATFDQVLAMEAAQEDKALVATVVGNMGVVYRDMKDFSKALSTFQRTMGLYQALGKPKGIAWMHRCIAEAYIGLEEHAKALASYEQALAVREELGDEAGVAAILFDMAFVYGSLKDPAKELSTFQRALAGFEALGDQTGAWKVNANIALVHEGLGNPAKALPAWQEASKGVEALGDKHQAAEILLRVAGCHRSVGDRPGSLRTLERAHAMAEELGDLALVKRTMSSIAEDHVELGEHAKAFSILQQLMARCKSQGDEHGAAGALLMIGGVHAARADFAKAISTFNEAMARFEALGDQAAVAATLASIGIAYTHMGEYAKALSAHEQCLARREASGDKAGAAAALVNMGSVHQSLGDGAMARSHFERGLALAEEVGARQWAMNALSNLAVQQLKSGDAAGALPKLKQTLERREALNDRAGVAMALDNLGVAYRSLGDHAAALVVHQRALEIEEALGDKAGAAMTYGNIGHAYVGLRDLDKALASFESGARSARSRRLAYELVFSLSGLATVHLQQGLYSLALRDAGEALRETENLLGGLGEEQGARARAQYTSLFTTGALAALLENDPAELLRFLESGRAGALLDDLDKREVLRWKAQSLPPELQRLDLEAQGRERAARDAYEQAGLRGDRGALTEAGQRLDEATEGVRSVVSRIQRELKQQAALFYPRARTIEEIRSSLRPPQALVVYGLVGVEAVALVLRPDGQRIVPLGKVADLLLACGALDATDRDTDVKPALDALRQLLVEPLALDEGVKQVLLSPEGPLCYLPFAALFEQPVAMTPSGTTHALLLEEERKPGKGILALGDPDYAGVSAGAQATYYRGRPLSALPASRAEAQAIGTQTMLGADASEAKFYETVATSTGWRAVHFACHGLVNVDRPMLSALALSRAGESDGFLTALEVLRTRIPADLAALSACETATGQIMGSEGIVGLTRAFMFAGAPRVICSLWKVDDEATSALMVKFYELWNPKDGSASPPAAVALKQAQEFVRDDPKHPQWKHPYYWAAWVLWGLPE